MSAHHSRARVLGSGAAALVVALALTSPSQAAPSPAGPSAAAVWKVSGTARLASGGVARAVWVNAVLHDTATKGTVIAKAKTSSSGSFTLTLRRSAALKSFAAQHGGAIDLDLIEMTHQGKMLVEGVAAGYAPAVAHVGTLKLRSVGWFDPAARVQAGGRAAASAPHETVSPDVMYVAHGQDEATTYEYGSASATKVTSGYGSSVDDFTASGEIEMADTSSASASGSFGSAPHDSSRGKNAAMELSAQLDVTGTQKCSHLVNDYGSPMAETCWYEDNGAWTGVVNEQRVPALSCSQQSYADKFTFTSHSRTRVFQKVQGQAFTAGVKLDFGGDFMKASTSYGTTAHLTYSFDLPDVKGYSYCLAGTDGPWAQASVVTVETEPRRTEPCGRRPVGSTSPRRGSRVADAPSC